MKHNYTCEVFNTLQYALATIQDNPVLQGVQLGLSILTSIILVTYRIWKWWNEAKKDGKINKQEVDEAFMILHDGLDEVNDKVNGKDKRDNG